jgi:methionyl-tRNA synthetase
MPGKVVDQRLPQAATWGQYVPGASVIKGDALFPRIKT